MDRIRKADASRHRLYGSWFLRRSVFGFAGSLEPSKRKYPQPDSWKAVVMLVKKFSDFFCGTAELLMKLALGRVRECLFPSEGGVVNDRMRS